MHWHISDATKWQSDIDIFMCKQQLNDLKWYIQRSIKTIESVYDISNIGPFTVCDTEFSTGTSSSSKNFNNYLDDPQYLFNAYIGRFDQLINKYLVTEI